MPKANNTERVNFFKSCLLRRSSKSPNNYLEGRLGVSAPTASKYINDPTLLKLRDLIALGLNEEEIRGLM